MVLQTGAPIPVWGTASPGEAIEVVLRGITLKTVADSEGKWRVDFPSTPPSSKSEKLVVKGSNVIQFEDVLFGSVWLASGQSNMEMGLQAELHGKAAIENATDDQIRLFIVPVATSLSPQADIAAVPSEAKEGKWQVCSKELMAATWGWNGFSAVGYYFARQLREYTQQPIGMILASKGGTPAEAWTSIDGLNKADELKPFVRIHDDIAREAANSGDKPPGDGGVGAPGNLFNAMIAPLIPYGIAGIIWYQGESNGDDESEAKLYRVLFPRLIQDWREKWKQEDLPFLFVQLPSFRERSEEPVSGAWPWVRDAQLAALSLPRTGMAVAIDLGDAKDIHPINKIEVGRRLSLLARKMVFGEKVVDSGPIVKKVEIDGAMIRISFDLKGGEFKVAETTRDSGALRGFAIAGADHRFVHARARIDGESVVVSSPEVSHPKAVRYNWADNPMGDLSNKDGLPASPFRTDDWN